MKTQTATPGTARAGGRLILLAALLSSALFNAPAGVGSSAGAAQGSITGEWLIELSRGNPDEAQLTIVRGSPTSGDGMRSSAGVPLSELQGLTREQARGPREGVKFRIVREAGTFECEGSFHEGKGSGFWRLVPNQNFVAAMRGRGYRLSTEKELLHSALFDLSVKAVDDLKAAGYDRLSFEELIETRLFKITPAFIREMGDAGFGKLSLQELVEASIFNVNARFVEEVRAMGLGRQPLGRLVELRVHRVTPEFVAEMRSVGFDNLSVEELVEARIFDVTREFVREMELAGYSHLTLEQLVEARIFKVDGDFIRRVKARRPDVTLEQLVEMRVSGGVK